MAELRLSAIRPVHTSDRRSQRGRPAEVTAPEVIALLQLLTPAGHARTVQLTRRQTAAIAHQAAAALLADTPPATEPLDGYVWCDTECAVHADEPDPYSYGTACEGPHHPLHRQQEAHRG